MGSTTVATIVAVAPIAKWLVCLAAGWIAAKHHSAVVTTVANAGVQATQAAVSAAVTAAVSGAKPGEIAKAAGVAAAATALPLVTVQDPTVTPPTTAGG